MVGFSSGMIEKILVLGVIEGLTEFLPVSSTAHLILAGRFLGFEGDFAKLFEVFIQLGAILSIVGLFWKRIWYVVRTVKSDIQSRLLVINLGLAFLPSAVVGLGFHRWIKAYLFTPHVVSTTLLVGGIVIVIFESSFFRKSPHRLGLEDLKPTQALGIGLCQSVSLIPGVSRAAATIIGGMAMGLSRSAALEFSFLLAIPTMAAACSFDLLANVSILEWAPSLLLGLGFTAAFVSALVAARALIGYVQNHSLRPFGYYRIVLGGLMLLFLES